MKDTIFFKQAELLLRVIPFVAAEKCFALKGGTAINFFIRDFPRLSVDIDLTYLPLEPRDITLLNIESSLVRIAQTIPKFLRGAKVFQSKSSQNQKVIKLIVQLNNIQIKIEPNTVIRGSVYPVQEMSLTKIAEEFFELSVSTLVLTVEDLYGGKICAALDRQHPRDLFDILLLLENEGLNEKIRKSFIVYLASHDRPMHEVLNPTRKDLSKLFESEFLGMTNRKISLEDLQVARETLIEQLLQNLTENERNFLLSLKKGSPEWGLLNIPHIEQLPAIQWKLLNIQKMTENKREEALLKLKASLRV